MLKCAVPVIKARLVLVLSREFINGRCELVRFQHGATLAVHTRSSCFITTNKILSNVIVQ